MSGQDFDSQAISEVISRNLDEPPTEQAQHELVEALTKDSRNRDAWIAEVALDRILQIHFEESRGRDFDRRVRRLAMKEYRWRRRRTVLKGLGIGGGLAATLLVLIALLLPPVQSSRYGESRRQTALWLISSRRPPVQSSRSGQRRFASQENLRQIGFGIDKLRESMEEVALGGVHAAEEPSKRHVLPAAYLADSQGKPLLSWRVLLLPFLGEEDLFNKFRLDEPWDSPNNQALLPEMPEVYRSPFSSQPGYTVYLAVPIDEGVIRPSNPTDRGVAGQRGLTISEVRDGLSNTVMVVEVAGELAVPWTRPHDYPIAPEFADVASPAVSRALEIWNSQNKVICDRVVLADGTVREVADGVSKAMITRSGGEILTESDW